MKFTLYILILFTGVSCTPKPSTAYDLLQRDDFWTLVHGAYFADGVGSVTLGFIGSDGDVIHLWLSPAHPTRVFLKRTYNDPAAVEVAAGSPAEQRVLALLSSCRFLQESNNILKPLPSLCATMLRDRKLPPPAGWPGVPESLLLPPPNSK